MDTAPAAYTTARKPLPASRQACSMGAGRPLFGGRRRRPVAVLQANAAALDALIAVRPQAREGESERIRDQFGAMGLVLEGGKGGTTWRSSR